MNLINLCFMSNVNADYLTCGELLQEYSILKEYQWDLHTPSNLLALGLLEGKYLASKKTTLIKRESIEFMIDVYLQLYKKNGKRFGL